MMKMMMVKKKRKLVRAELEEVQFDSAVDRAVNNDRQRSHQDHVATVEQSIRGDSARVETNDVLARRRSCG
jgi:hypothetical protein